MLVKDSDRFPRFRCPARRSDLSPLPKILGLPDAVYASIRPSAVSPRTVAARRAPRRALGSDMAVKNRPAARQRDFDGGFVLAVSGAAGLGYDAPDATGGQFFDECCEDRFAPAGDAAFVHRNPIWGSSSGVLLFSRISRSARSFSRARQFLRSVYFCHVFRSFRV